jgi:exopolysaccharide production protein ExoZ
MPAKMRSSSSANSGRSVAIIEERRLSGLQSLRGIAACAVLFQHVTFYTCQAKGIDYQPYLKVDFGRVGVQLFFVVSGFVMAGCLPQGPRFMLNRVVRIYPGFWLSILMSFVLLSHPVFGWTFDWKSALLIPAALNNSYRIPYWTLVYEMAFYVVVYALALFCVKTERVTRVLLIWLLMIVFVTKYVTIMQFEPGSWILFARLNVYFILGMLMGLTFEAVKLLNSVVVALGAVILWSAGDAFAAGQPLPSDLMLGGAFCGAVLLGIRHIKVPALEWLGDASYGIYLLHVPIAVLTTYTLTRQFPTIQPAALWGITFIASLGGATVFGRIETGMHKRIRRLLRIRVTGRSRANTV